MRQLVKMKKMENIKKHVCTLPIIEDVLVTYISDGHFVLLRRWWKSYFVIDDKHKYTKACFKSYFIIRREKKYHLRYHYSMIHPFSKAKLGSLLINIGNSLIFFLNVGNCFYIFQATLRHFCCIYIAIFDFNG